MLWILKSTAWVGALAIVFVPLFTVNLFKIYRRELSTREKLRMDADSDALKREQIKSFLRNALGNPDFGVFHCYAFGSVVANYQVRDVDIVIQFDTSEQTKVRTYRARLRYIESNFQEFYDLKLHLQTFLVNENDAVQSFLTCAGAHERLI